MKKKIAILIGIAVCTMLLTSPVLASAGYSKIYGNANEDDVLDMRDVTYLKLVIFGKKPATTFADANYDRKISMLDIGQTKLIILGKEKQLTLVDRVDRVVTINKPVERVVLTDLKEGARLLIHLGAEDKIVAISDSVKSIFKKQDHWSPIRYAAPELEDLPNVGHYKDPNMELIVSLEPDVIFAYPGVPDVANAMQETLSIPTCTIDISEDLDFEWCRMVSHIVDKEERAEELISYANKKIDEVAGVTSEIPDSEKPRVYLAFWSLITRTPLYYAPVELAEGINVAKRCPPATHYAADVSKEQVIKWNPDIILLHGVFPPHKLSIEDVLTDPDLQTGNAVKNGKVYYTQGYRSGWDSATGLIEVFYMAKLFHPDKFEDLDMEKEGNEILKGFYEVDGLYTKMLEMSDVYRWD